MSDEILTEYMEAFKDLYGHTPKMVPRGNGWWRIEDRIISCRISDLKQYAANLRARANKKPSGWNVCAAHGEFDPDERYCPHCKQPQQRIDT